MEWNNYCVTNAGVEVLKKAIGGKKVTITAAKSGTDTVPESELKEQSVLSGTMRNATIANATNQPEGYRVTLRVTNTGVKSSYIFKQLGLFATAEDESEVLFAILQSENGETVPDESELYTYDVSLIIAISDTSNITVNVDKTSYVTEEELDGHKTDKTNPHGVTKAQVGLGNVPNVSTNDQTPIYTVPTANAELISGEKLGTAFGKIARAVASLIAHIANKSNPHSVTKAQVGLGNADNTSDVNKPISSATQTALNGKSDKAHKHKTADISDMPSALPADGGNADTVDGKHANDFAASNHTHTAADIGAAASSHTHTKSQITDFPASLPANGGNSATVNGHTVASDVPANAKFTDTQYSPFAKSGTGAKAGLVPAPSTTAGASKYLCENGTWAVPPDTKYSAATTTSAGLFSASDKSKLDGIEAGADKYKLPVASETLGGVKTGPSVVVNSDGTMSIVKDSHYHSVLEAIDVTGKTIDLNTLNLSDAPGQIKHYVEKTAGGSANITNAPQAGMFLMVARNIRWASSTDYITEQVFVSVTTKKEYGRWCTSGTWSAWVERNYTNTWRGIQNNLTSDSATDSLSAAQGKALKALVDSKASSGHTHSYAGSSSVGGAATSADKINTDAGSATQPVYIRDGVPKATTYTLGKSVPASAVFTDTWKALVGSTTTAAGTAGYAPAPAKGASNRYLRCDGAWVVPPNTVNTVVIKQGSALQTAIDISSRKQAYIEFYKVSITAAGASESFSYPFVITDTTPATAVTHKSIYGSADIAIVYSLTTDGKITFGGDGGWGYKILLFD
nr:MAG TPA: Minor structural protein [Caudoviricetes sp.]